DIWAFGMIYYELLTGYHPFHASDPALAMYRILEWQPDRIRSRVPECPEALDNVVAKLLSKDRESRFQSLEDVLFDTAPILQSLYTIQGEQLIPEGETLKNEGKLDRAQEVARRVISRAPAGEDGRAWWQKLQTAAKRREIKTRVDELCARTDRYAEARDYQN